MNIVQSDRWNKEQVIVQTERLFLRPMVYDDADVLQRLFGDPMAMEFIPVVPKNREETLEWIGKVRHRYQIDGFCLYACIKKEDDAFIGYCGLLLQKDIDGQDEVEVGYVLFPQFWKNGFATEAAVACKNFGFDHFGFEKIISLIRPENLPSRRVAERNGMIVEKEIVRWGNPHLVYMARKSLV